MPRVVKVAVVGSGLAGLTAGYLLGLPHDRDDVELQVHLFEKVKDNNTLGNFRHDLIVDRTSHLRLEWTPPRFLWRVPISLQAGESMFP